MRKLFDYSYYFVRYAGKSWKEKVRDLRSDMSEVGARAMVVTALDEIAWLFNIRGEAIPYSPVVRAYAFITKVHHWIESVNKNDIDY